MRKNLKMPLNKESLIFVITENGVYRNAFIFIFHDH